MCKYTLRLVLMIMVMIMMYLVVLSHAQKSYSISSIVSNIKVLENLSSISIVEEFEYNFNGSYSRIGRPLPYDSVTRIDPSSIKAFISNSNYSVSAKLEPGIESFFIVSTLSPATPSNKTTNLSIRISFSIVPKLEVSTDTVWRYHFKDNAYISNIYTEIIFDSSFSSYNLTSPNGKLSFFNNQRIATFNVTGLYSNTEFKPEFKIIGYSSKAKFYFLVIGIPIIVMVPSICVTIIIIIGIVAYFLKREKVNEKPNSNLAPVVPDPKPSTRVEQPKPKKETSNYSSRYETYDYSTTVETSTYQPPSYDYSGGYGGGCDYGGGGCDYSGGGGGGGCDYGGSSGFAD